MNLHIMKGIAKPHISSPTHLNLYPFGRDLGVVWPGGAGYAERASGTV